MIDNRRNIRRKKAIKLISSKFTYVEDLANELSDSEIERLYDNAENGEYDD